MRLVKRLPLALPEFRPDGSFFDDLTQSGAKHPGYSLSSGAKDNFPNCISLRATTGTGARLTAPARCSNFEAEIAMRRIEGTVRMHFRWADTQNRIHVGFDGTNDRIYLTKVVDNVSSSLGAKANIGNQSLHAVGVRAIGSLIEVYLDGARVIVATVSELINNVQFNLDVYDAAIGTARGEFKYLAIKPL